MKPITIRMDEELYKAARIKAIATGKTVANYFSDLVKEDLKEKE